MAPVAAVVNQLRAPGASFGVVALAVAAQFAIASSVYMGVHEYKIFGGSRVETMTPENQIACKEYMMAVPRVAPNASAIPLNPFSHNLMP
mmetsp:Transcript_22639/g.43247  ORF Transcript_22639/g.43247 Transcript_22639/m.43247 type:complete len:90 (+) Transcript_22639:93-362(+)|eukprot:CAMPEP_0114248734 /NCGR_PEP_ID=MMETSP0058-20121206/13740_1 /TAXON_ID=36894 /ORGANISM="Pyramimonas parkeae, CCMP726" /LENGTH=89 /DNA_ID=CAMNT_0001362179 /DNA_START=199 /DNA_END=468 /DNA_ORIENTATION=+